MRLRGGRGIRLPDSRARRLRVSRASVYKFVAEGRLAQVRSRELDTVLAGRLPARAPVQGPEAPPPVPAPGGGPAPARRARRALARPLRDRGLPRASPGRGHRAPQVRREPASTGDPHRPLARLNRLHLTPEVKGPHSLAATLLLGPGNPKNEGPGAADFRQELRGLQMVGAAGFEPAPTCTPSAVTERVEGGQDSQALGNTRDGEPAGSSGSPDFAGLRGKFAAGTRGRRLLAC